MIFYLAGAREKIEAWRCDYEEVRPYSALASKPQRNSRGVQAPVQKACAQRPNILSRAPPERPLHFIPKLVLELVL